VNKNKAVVCCLLSTSYIILSEKKKRKRKMWSKKCYLKRNISCDAHLLNELLEIECLEMMPSWCRQVNWGNCGIPWVNCAVLCVKDGWKGQFWGLRYCLSKLRTFMISLDIVSQPVFCRSSLGVQRKFVGLISHFPLRALQFNCYILNNGCPKLY